jgi:hypothetical protein
MRRLVGGDASLDRAFSGLISRGGWPRRRAAAASGHCRVSTCDVLGKPSASLTLEDLALIAARAFSRLTESHRDSLWASFVIRFPR